MSDNVTSDEASRQSRTFSEGAGHAESDELSRTLSSRQHSAGELIPIQGEKRSGDSGYPSRGQTPTGNSKALDGQYPSLLEPGSEKPDVQQESSQTLAAGQDIRPRGESGLEAMEAGAVVGGQAVGTIEPREPDDAVDPPTNTSDIPTFRRMFRMVLHRDNDQTAQRVVCLDTGATLDVISLDVVNELGLKKEPYLGGEVKPLGEPIRPEWQVSFDWHVCNKSKTYTSTFVVLNEQLSRDFDVLLGYTTIERIGFFRPNDEIWFMVTDGSPEENEDVNNGSLIR
ncbi:MAG: hypothetical protein L6R39_002011 [Caloplaca ligustica]|nr:MAG: hypothetical protein L6R39_002011 [Caloplaca ligustica]